MAQLADAVGGLPSRSLRELHRRRLEEGEGIEPLALRATPVFETGCRPFSGTLLIEDDEPSSDSICLLLVFLFSNLVAEERFELSAFGL